MKRFCWICKTHVEVPDAKPQHFEAFGHDDTKVDKLQRNVGRRQLLPRQRFAAENA